MSDDCIATARNIIQARLAKDQELMGLEIRSVKFDYGNRGILQSSMYVQKLQGVCQNHLEARAQIILETLEQNLIGPGISSPDLNSKLKAEFLTHFTPHFQMISRVLQPETRGQSYYKHITLDHSRGRLISEYHARIDHLCRKLATEANKLQYSVMNKTEVTISGTANNIQLGDHNVQQIYSSLEAAIDARSGTPEQKAEAKSLAKRYMENPIIAAILSEGTKAVVKTILS